MVVALEEKLERGLFAFGLLVLVGDFGMGLDVLAGLQQVVALCAHEVHGFGETVLDEVVATGFVVESLDALEVDFW